MASLELSQRIKSAVAAWREKGEIRTQRIVVVDPADSRVNRVNLTAQGRDLQGKVTPLRETGLGKATQRLSEEEVRELKRLLNQIYHNMSS